MNPRTTLVTVSASLSLLTLASPTWGQSEGGPRPLNVAVVNTPEVAVTGEPAMRVVNTPDVNVVGEPDRSVPPAEHFGGPRPGFRAITCSGNCAPGLEPEGFVLDYVQLSVASGAQDCFAGAAFVMRDRPEGHTLLLLLVAPNANEAITLNLPRPISLSSEHRLLVWGHGQGCIANGVFGGLQAGDERF